MRVVKQIAGISALLAVVLCLSLAVGNVWASAQAEVTHEAAVGHATELTHEVSDTAHAATAAADHVTETHVVDAHADTGHGAGHGDSLSAEKLKDLAFRVMNFAVLIFILVKFGAKPIANALSGRRRQIKEEIEDLEAQKVDAVRAYEEFSAKLATVEKDIDSIIEKAVAQAEIEKTKILERAEQAAGDIQRQAEMVIANEITAAKRSLKNDAADQAAIMAEELIVKNLTAGDQIKIVEDYLDKVGAVQ